MALFVLFGLTAQAQVAVNILNGQFTTYLEVPDISDFDTTPNYYDTSRTMVSASPVSDEMSLWVTDSDGSIAPYDGIPNNFWAGQASSTADIFDISVNAGVAAPTHDNAWAKATSQIVFTPLVNQTQMINVAMWWPGEGADGQISLIDLTSNTQLWLYSYGLDIVGGANWPYTADTGVDPLNIETSFSSSDVYELTIQADCFDDYAGAGSSTYMNLSGLQVVPEPSTSLLLAMCGTSLMIFRRQRR